MKTILTVFGTRPEVIKLAPVLRKLQELDDCFRVMTVSSGQHTDLVQPMLDLFSIRVDHDLAVGVPQQSLNGLCARLLEALDPVFLAEKPDLVLVQGDTTTALAGTLAAFHREIPVAHIEAGLRSGDVRSPYPEELNRRLISRIATYHFAATPGNRASLLREGVAQDRIFVTGNPVVDALQTVMKKCKPGPSAKAILKATAGLRRLVVTTHRREAFGPALDERLRALREFVAHHDDVAMILPVHPNPRVRDSAIRILSDHPRIHLVQPLGYADFLALLKSAWLVAGDSGGIQEEVASLGKPLLILRENTERPEAVAAGYARLVGRGSRALSQLLEEAYRGQGWVSELPGPRENPFGNGRAADRIVACFGRIAEARPRARRLRGPQLPSRSPR